MQELLIKIPDKKLTFFKELVKQLGFEIEEKSYITNEHKRIVSERIAKSDKNPEILLDWEKEKQNFTFD